MYESLNYFCMSLHTLPSVRVLDWFSSTQKEFCITLWHNIVEICCEDDVGLLLLSGRRNKRLGYVEGHLSWSPRPMDTQGTNKERSHTNTDYLTSWVAIPINSLCSLETTKQRREPFSWVMCCDFGWCQRSWVSFTLFLFPSSMCFFGEKRKKRN